MHFLWHPERKCSGGMMNSRRRNRIMLTDAPLHKRQDMVGAHVSKELRPIVGRRSLRIKSGHVGKIMRGEHKGKEGKITRVALKPRKVYMEGVMAKKADGKEVPLAISPSNIMITRLESEKPKKGAQPKV